MTDTTYTDLVGPAVNAAWLNDVNNRVYRGVLPAGGTDNQYSQGGVGSVTRTVASKLQESVSVKDFGAVGDGVADDTAAIQAAINTNLSVYFPPGIYLCSGVTIPAGAVGATYYGPGYYYYGATLQAVIKAKTSGQSNIFALANGANNITFKSMRIDGAGIAQKCIDGTYGSFLSLYQVGIFGSTQCGVYSLQGVGRWDSIFVTGHTLIGAQAYSDTSIVNSEFSGGTIPLQIVAGGCRLSNVWVNTGSVAQIQLTPLNSLTSHINTSLVNVYVGETQSVTSAPVISIIGTAAQRVQQVMISNSHFVNAAAGTTINGFINAAYANDLTITGCTFRGQDTYGISTQYTAYAVLTNNVDGFTFTGNNVRGINTNAIDISNTQGLTISGNTFRDCGSTYATGTQGANIIIRDTLSSGVIGNNHFYVSNGSTVSYALNYQSTVNISFENNFFNFANGVPVVAASGTYVGKYQYIGQLPIQQQNTATQNFSQSGSFSTASGSNTTNVVTLPTSAANQSYIIYFQQSGTGSNATIGGFTLYNTAGGAITIGNTGTATLVNTVGASGATITFTQGAGYGATTWNWTLLRMS